MIILLLFNLTTVFSNSTIHKVDSLKYLLNTSNQMNDKILLIKLLAMAYFNYDIDSSLVYSTRSLELAKQNNILSDIADSYNLLAVSHFIKGDIIESLNYSFSSLDINEKLHRNIEITEDLTNISGVYEIFNDFKTSIKYMTKALELAKNLNDKKIISMITTFLAGAYYKSGNLEMGNIFLNSAAKYKETFEVPILKNYYLLSLGHYYELTKNYKQAILIFKDSIEKEKNNITAFTIRTKIIGRLYYKMALEENNLKQKMNYLKNSEYYLKTCDSSSIKLKLLYNQNAAEHLLSLVYKEMKQFNKAWIYLEKSNNIKDSILSFNSFSQIRTIEQINSNEKLKIAQDEKEKLKIYVYYSLSIGFLVFILLALIFTFYFKQKRTNAILKYQNIQIINNANELEKVNDRLNADNIETKKIALIRQLEPHFIFNTLSVLKSLIYDDIHKASKYIDLLADYLRFSFGAYKQDLITVSHELKFAENYFNLQKIRFNESIFDNINVDEKHLLKKIPVFSIQTIIENAIKHNAFTEKNKLLIEISSSNGKICIANNIIPGKANEKSGVGLINLNNRYKMILNKEIEIFNDSKTFLVNLPTE